MTLGVLAATTRRRRGELHATPVIRLLFRRGRGLHDTARGGAGSGQPVPRKRESGPLAVGHQMPFESVARLNAAEPTQVGRSEVEQSADEQLRHLHDAPSVPLGRHGCHLVRHHIVVAGRQPGHDYRLTWCRTQSGEWKTKS
jgi:hypothetical protein